MTPAVEWSVSCEGSHRTIYKFQSCLLLYKEPSKELSSPTRSPQYYCTRTPFLVVHMSESGAIPHNLLTILLPVSSVLHLIHLRGSMALRSKVRDRLLSVKAMLCNFILLPQTYGSS